MPAKDLKVLMISSDRKICEEGSGVSLRMKEYGSLIGELHIIVLSDRKHSLQSIQIAPNIWVYPTNSYINYLRPRDTAKLGQRLIREKKFTLGTSLITADSIEGAWAGLKIKKETKIPLEVQIHTEIFSPYFKGFQNRVRQSYAKKIFKEVTGVRVVSNSLKMEIERLTTAPIEVLPIYINKEQIITAEPKFDLHTQFGWHFILLTVSRLEPEKNLGLALEILAKVREIYPSTGLVIVGSGSEENKLKKLSHNLGLDGFVAFMGWQDDLASYYKTATLYLQTSFYEGYGLSLVEAGLSGLPVVSTPVGIAAELTHSRDAFIFPVYAQKLFVEGIQELIEKASKRENLRINLKRTLEKKLLSKEEYLQKLIKNWLDVASRYK